MNAFIVANTLLRQAAQLDRTTNTTYKRLATGLRLNSASDDAAGLSMASKLKALGNGFAQASQNIQDAVSLLQTAEGALDSLTGAVQRLRELAVQAANDSLTAADRDALQAEANQLRHQINQTAQGTEFNSMQILRGDPAVTTPSYSWLRGGQETINVPPVGMPAPPSYDLAVTGTIDDPSTGYNDFDYVSGEAGSWEVYRDGVALTEGDPNGYSLLPGPPAHLVFAGTAVPSTGSATAYAVKYVRDVDATYFNFPGTTAVSVTCPEDYIRPAANVLADESTLLVQVNGVPVPLDPANGYSLSKVPGDVISDVQTYTQYEVKLNGAAKLLPG